MNALRIVEWNGNKKYRFQREKNGKGGERKMEREERGKRETINSETREILHKFFAYFLNTDSEKCRKKGRKK